jgi:LmbE family N-acetylglucosaminyl deacetylase
MLIRFIMLTLLVSSLPLTLPTRAQQIEDTAALYQSLLDLTYPFTVMCVAAHPDDEDRDALAFYRKKYGARTVIVTSTRGEGGQNSQGPELYEELGVLRVREMEAAARRLDAITFNLAMPDFGFSKSAEETFTRWNRKEALRRMVYAIRFFQPDIIITQHDRKTGHGHHQATRLLLEEAFDLAADRQAYTEQISARLDPWRPKRLFVKTISRERYDTEFDVNEVASKINQKYSQIAYDALQEHRSQGPWPQPNLSGERMARYNLVKNTEGEFRRWYLLGQGLAEPPIYERVRPVVFDRAAPGPQQAVQLPRAELISRLVKAINLTRAFLKGEGKGDRKTQELEARLQQALLLAARISFTVQPGVEKIAQGLDFNARAVINNGGTLSLQVQDLRYALPDTWELKENTKVSGGIEPGASSASDFSITVSLDTPPTLPAVEHIQDLNYLEPQIGAVARLSFSELEEPLIVSAQARVEIAAAVELEVAPNELPVNVIDAGQTDSFPLQVKIVNNLRSPLRGRVELAQSQPVRITPDNQQLAISPLSSAVTTFLLTVGRPAPEGFLNLPVTFIDEYGRAIAASSLKIHLINVRTTPNTRIGYLRSYDFTLPTALKFLGLRSTELTVADIATANLSALFDTIVIDNRAYLAQPDLVKVNSKLIDFVRNGGNLVVFYQRPSDWNDNMLSPYPIKMGSGRVTDETAQVTILQPDHPLLNRPNKIVAEDFNNWVQERGLNFPSEWDDRYQALLSSADTGEEQLKGGLLVTEHGRGRYIFTSYVIYRQLRSFVPGAYHLFSNMISYR